MTLSENIQSETGKSETRRRAILQVAREAFLAQGYAATSMSEIATRLGGSKGTLYNYFKSKEDLFAAFMVDTCQGPANAIFDHLPPVGEDLRASLIEVGVGLLSFILRDMSMAIHRLVVAESGRFPELGRVFYETGPRLGERRLGDFMQNAINAGRLRRCDPVEAGRWFKALTLNDIYSRRLWGVIDELTPEQIRTHVGEAADIFLAAFGPLEDGTAG
jgi:AcrR family transcriptional regulator